MEQREIKFRAWNIQTKRMLKDSINLNHGEGLDYNQAEEDFILMQFTGEKDKNKKEIYEGDILKFEFTKDNKNRGLVHYHGVVWYAKKSKWALRRKNKDKKKTHIVGLGKIKLIDHEVIGNIYENPELLEDKE